MPGAAGPGPAPLLVLAVGDAADAVAAGRCRDGDRRRVLGDLVVTDHDSRTHGAVLGAPRVP